MGKDLRKQSFETLAIHAGQEPDPATGAVMVPIFQTITFAQDALGKHKGYEYSRTDNPHAQGARDVPRRARRRRAGASRSPRAWPRDDAMLRTCSTPAITWSSRDDVYGGTFRLFDKVLRAPRRRRCTSVDMRDAGARRSGDHAEDEARVDRDADEPDAQGRRHRRDRRGRAQGARRSLVVDNTFATPVPPAAARARRGRRRALDDEVPRRPLRRRRRRAGRRRSPELRERLAFLQNAVGGVPGPFDCWLVLRGTKTLARAHGAALRERPRAIAGVARRASEGRERDTTPASRRIRSTRSRARQMRGFGGMISFELKGGGEEAAASCVAARTKIFALAESLGGVESLIEHPARMTHALGRRAPSSRHRRA